MKKSQTLFQSYYRLRGAMSAPSVAPERKAELESLSLRLKTTAKAAAAEESMSETAKKAIDDIRLLQEHTARTGFRTTRGQNDILATLNGPDLVAVLKVVKQ